jgi:hypothetical protein
VATVGFFIECAMSVSFRVGDRGVDFGLMDSPEYVLEADDTGLDWGDDTVDLEAKQGIAEDDVAANFRGSLLTGRSLFVTVGGKAGCFGGASKGN